MYRFLECRAGQYMTRSVITVTRQVTLRDLKALFDKHDFNSFPVVEGGKLVGIVTKFDFLRAFVFTTSQMVPHYDDLMKSPVQQIMTERVSSIEPTTPLTRVLELMVMLKARSLPVAGSQSELVGVISREDVMRALGEATQEAR
jgi:CBS domain-containing protein